MNGKRILILYTSIGLGHKSIAENIGFYLAQADYEVRLEDSHKVQEGTLAKRGKQAYQFLISNLPFIWDWLHSTQWFISLALPFRTKIASRNYKNTLELINNFKPDAIISCHNTASAIVSYLKKQGLYTGSFGIAFSDFYLHRFWLFDSCDFYLANTEEQKREMKGLGIPAEKVFVCGITLKPKLQINIEETKKKLGIPPNNKVILYSSGSQAIGLSKGLLKQLSALKNTTILVACGKDSGLAEHLNKKFAATNIMAFGYYNPMGELYAISDLFISKPGGLSIAEALLWQLPILISYILPGGEPFNYQYLLRKKLVMPKTSALLAAVTKELQTGEFKNQLAGNPERTQLFGKEQALIKGLNFSLN